MEIPFKTVATFAGLVLLLALQYQNCSSYGDPSLFDGSQNAGSSSSTPSEVRLDSPTGILDVSLNEKAISFGGQCNTGLSKKHYIEVQLYDSNRQPVQVREDSTCPVGGSGLSSDCFRATQFRCEHGRYYIHLPLNCATGYRGLVQSAYILKGQMVILDPTTGQEVRDAKASWGDRWFTISWKCQ